MAGYRCYLLDAEDHILQAHEIECDNDVQAQSAAQHFLTREPFHHAVEVWERARRIIKLDRQRTPRLPRLPHTKPVRQGAV